MNSTILIVVAVLAVLFIGAVLYSNAQAAAAQNQGLGGLVNQGLAAIQGAGQTGGPSGFNFSSGITY
jgi:hypothetical protein